jgi:serine-type D-Ala-D-Ala carboxypeptidase/endopeptidase (penicillin-binding protein 4)
MRGFLVVIGAVAAVAAAGAASASAKPVPRVAQHPRAVQQLHSTLVQRLQQAGGQTGAYVVDLSTGQTLFSSSANVPRLPASVEKLYTTSTALLRFGPAASLTTSLLGQGTLSPQGAWNGTLYLRGGGDPTFGSTSCDQYSYGTGATVQRLVANLKRQAGIKTVSGRVLGDESYFDSLRGTPASGFSYSFWVEGSLSALVYNRGILNQGATHVAHPAAYAAQQLVSALRAGHVGVAKATTVGTGITPTGTRVLATVPSPPVSKLIALTNTPSDNFFAEMLLKGIGARFGGRGSTAAGASVVRSELAGQFGISPVFNDGSGLSRSDFTTPRQVVTLLSRMASNSYFVNSLAVGGETGTLQGEMRGTMAQGRCRGKTGTLTDVASLAGYCQALDGHTLAFAFMMNSLSNPDYGHTVEANMAVALARYNG